MKNIKCISPDGRSFTTKGEDYLPDIINISNEAADTIKNAVNVNTYQMSIGTSTKHKL